MRLRHALPIVVALAGAVALPSAQQTGDSIPVPLTDPARPATVRVDLMNGAIIIRGENRKDVLVTARPGPDDNDRSRRGRGPGRVRPDDPSLAGFTRLTQRAGFEITESNNIVSIDSDMNRSGDIELRVPARTNLNLEGLNGTGITVENVEGEIETEHLNGQIDVTLPATAKANLRMRSDNGEIITNFDVQVRQTPTPTPQRRGNQTRIQVNESIVGAINGGGPEFELRTFNGNVILRRGQ
jgi:hypothetical protein